VRDSEVQLARCAISLQSLADFATMLAGDVNKMTEELSTFAFVFSSQLSTIFRCTYQQTTEYHCYNMRSSLHSTLIIHNSTAPLGVRAKYHRAQPTTIFLWLSFLRKIWLSASETIPLCGILLNCI